MPHIAVVDADRMAQAFAYSSLRKLGHPAVICRDTAVAWAVIQDNPDIELVLADLELLQREELRLVQRIRAWENTRQLPVVVYAAMVGARTIAELLEGGISEVLRKPLQNAEVAEALGRLLRGPGTRNFQKRHPGG